MGCRRTHCLILALSGVWGCGASHFDGAVYRGEGYSFRVPQRPAGWQTIEVSSASLAYRDDANGATIAVSGRCGSDSDDVPLASLTHHLFLQFTDRDILNQNVVPFDGREAMHTVMLAKLDGVPKKFDVWVMKKDGCVFDLVYIARPDRYEVGVGPFTRFVQGFSTVVQ